MKRKDHIDPKNREEIDFWTLELRVTEEKLREVMHLVGNSISEIKKHLSKGKDPRNFGPGPPW